MLRKDSVLSEFTLYQCSFFENQEDNIVCVCERDSKLYAMVLFHVHLLLKTVQDVTLNLKVTEGFGIDAHLSKTRKIILCV